MSGGETDKPPYDNSPTLTEDLVAALFRVKALHRVHATGRWCKHCGQPYPCATIRALEATDD